MLSAFLPDSGVPTRGLPWTTTNELPIEWDSPQPVASEGDLQNLVRDVVVTVHGNDVGIQSVVLVFQELDSWLAGPLEQAMAADGIALSPLKCSRETEPPSFGNVVWNAKAPGKLPTPLWMSWNCAHDGCGIALERVFRYEVDAHPLPPSTSS